LANAVIALENAAIVQSKEVVLLSKQWPTYRGKHIGTDEIKAWYQQVQSVRDQRILFDLLKRTRVLSEAFIHERLKTAHTMLRRAVKLPEFIIRKAGDRRRDILLVYVDGEGKSGPAYASLYAEENGIAAECVMSDENFQTQFAEHCRQHGRPALIVIMDDIAATGTSLAGNLQRFTGEFAAELRSIPVRAVTLVATQTGQNRILQAISRIEGVDIDFRNCEMLTKESFAFPTEGQVWSSDEEEARAKALCVDLGSKIYHKNPLGFGNMGLLVVFPTTVPNNSLPILHSYARPGSGLSWVSLFPKITN
jgi:hypothetical protein